MTESKTNKPSMQKWNILLISQIAVIAVCFAILYYPTITHMVSDWLNNDNYSHGFIVPLIAAYMIWQQREDLNYPQPYPSYWGLALLFAGMALFIVGNIGAELYTMRFSIVIAIFGLTIFLFGISIGRKIAAPVFYLVFMIPLPAIIWNKISFPLQIFAAKLSAGLISMVGIPVLRHGNILELANTTLEVIDACSGLRSLTSLLALSAAFAFVSSLKKEKKWILFFSAIPIAIVVNVIRLTVTAILARLIGPESAQGFLHDFSGILIFVVALLLLFAIYTILARLEKNSHPEETPKNKPLTSAKPTK